MKKESINFSNLEKGILNNMAENQSVRTTFKLSEDCLKAIEELLKINNIKPKELFNKIFENEFLFNTAIKIAQESKLSSNKHFKRKTFVISKKTLRLLNKASKENNISRDLIVESIITIFFEFFKQKWQEEIEKEKKAMVIIDDLWEKAEVAEKKLKSILEEDHPILDRISTIIIIIHNLSIDIDAKIKTGKPIDPDGL